MPERTRNHSKAPEKVGCDEIDSCSEGAEATEHMDDYPKHYNMSGRIHESERTRKGTTVLGKSIEPENKPEREKEVDAGT